MTVTVLNIGILSYPKHVENARLWHQTTAYCFAPADHAAMARACGMNAVTVSTVEGYGAVIAEVFATGESILIDAFVTSTVFPSVTLFDSLESGASSPDLTEKSSHGQV